MQNEHQQSRRVGPPVPSSERGFVLMPLLIWLAGAAIEWGLARLACGGMMW